MAGLSKEEFAVLVATDGRSCRFCGCVDTDVDPVDKAMGCCRPDSMPLPMAWYMDKPKHGQKNEGMVCFYCYSVFAARYKHKQLGMAKVIEMMGQSQEENRAFLGRRDGCVQWCIEHGGRKERVQWADVDKKLLTYDDEVNLTYADPEDEHWEFNLYVQEKGHPSTNNLGHKEDYVQGRHIVIVPGKKIWKVKRSRTQRMRLRQVVDSGTQNFTPHQVEEKANDLMQLMDKFMPRAEGAGGHDRFSSMLFGSGASSSSSSALTSPPRPTSAAASACAGLDEGVSFGFGGFGVMRLPVSAAPSTALTGGGSAGDNAQEGKSIKATRAKVEVAVPKVKTGSGATGAGAGGGCGGSGGGGGSAKKSVQGRPQKDLNIAVDATCKEFALTDEGVQTFDAWFGSSWKANRRTIKRNIESLTTRVNQTDQADEYALMATQKKRLDSMMAVLDFVHKHGVDHQGLSDTMDSQDHFLAMEPAATLEWTPYLLGFRLTHRVRKCSSPHDFWNSLKEATAKLDAKVMVEKQSMLIAEKVISIVRGEDMKATLAKFFDNSIDFGVFSEKIKGQLHDVRVIVLNEECTSLALPEHCASLKQAVKNAANHQELKVSSSLMVLPSGRSLVAHADAFAKKGLLTITMAGDLDRSIDDVDKALRVMTTWPTDDFKEVLGLRVVDNLLVEMNTAEVLRQHFEILTKVAVEAIVRKVVHWCLAGLQAVLGPLLAEEMGWEAWSKVSLDVSLGVSGTPAGPCNFHVREMLTVEALGMVGWGCPLHGEYGGLGSRGQE